MATVSSIGCTQAKDESPRFKITTKRDDDRVQITVEQEKSVLSVHSPFGIGQAVIERTNENWPDVLMLRLHLKGLESFEITNGKVTIHAAASSKDSEQQVRLWKDGQEDVPLDSESPYWMEVEITGGNGKPAEAGPLKDGCFEIMLPKALFEGNPRSFTVSWIDFYR